MYQVYAGVN